MFLWSFWRCALHCLKHPAVRVTILDHRQLRVGTLAAILAEVAAHLGIDRAELAARLFER